MSFGKETAADMNENTKTFLETLIVLWSAIAGLDLLSWAITRKWFTNGMVVTSMVCGVIWALFITGIGGLVKMLNS
jgi:hypothetical protein